MARKFVLVDQDMYKSLLSRNEAEYVSTARSKLDSTLLDNEVDASTKNAMYNKELYNFLKLHNEAMNKPVKVEITKEPSPALQQPAPQVVGPFRTPRRRPRAPATPGPNEQEQRLLTILNQNKATYGISQRGQVLNYRNRAIPNSNVKTVVKHLLNPQPFAFDPPGTSELRAKIMNHAETRDMIPHNLPTQEGEGKFRPSLWRF